MRDLESVIRRIFVSLDKEFSAASTTVNYALNGETLTFLVGGRRIVRRLRLNFDNVPASLPQLGMSYKTAEGNQQVDISGGVSLSGNSIIIDAGLVADMQLTATGPGPCPQYQIQMSPGYYAIALPDSDLKSHFIDMQVDLGDGWQPADAVNDIEPTLFDSFFAPATERPLRLPLIWSGDVTIKGVQIIERPLVITAGRRIKMGEGATLIIKNRLQVEGTAQLPVRFMPLAAGQQPWGSVVVIGTAADGSFLSHCEMSSGSGLKTDLFEYTGMLSIHDVLHVAVNDCLFRDSNLVDDMVHVVYADIRFDRCTFSSASSDALDLDISQAYITNSRFATSGNDAIDLMSTQATVTGSEFINNGDKGISVGENSRLLAIDNRLSGNQIGIQAKDGSLALLFNQSLDKNRQALHAYKKNWRYGSGGNIYIAKSHLSDNNEPPAADKHSTIRLFDSFTDQAVTDKNITAFFVDNQQPELATLSETFLPDPAAQFADVIEALQIFDAGVFSQRTASRRGAQ